MSKADKIKFGTDGWRAIIADDFTVDNVARVTDAVARWLKEVKRIKRPVVMLGYDCRFGGALFSETVARVLCSHGIKTHQGTTFVSTPMVSLGTRELNADIGVIITASHNPPDYNGYKLKGPYGGPLLPDEVGQIEGMIRDENPKGPEASAVYRDKGLLLDVDLEKMYIDRVTASFDLEAIRHSNFKWAYDAMYGAGQLVMKKLMPDISFLHCEYNPSFMGMAPEPIDKNLREFSEMIRKAGDIDCGLATDGDADRIGLYDRDGKFVDSHHLILLLIHYLYKYKNMRGKVVTAFSTTPRIRKMCEHYGIETETVRIGFKWICGVMLKEDVLLGGEESGGIAIKGHIPERDGIWIGLVIWEFMAKSGKSLRELIDEVYGIVGRFSFERSDLRIDEGIKQRVLENCRSGKYKAFGNYEVERVEDLDGFKYFFKNGDWLMIRASGTEPVLRTYAEAESRDQAFDILKAGKATLLG